MTTVPFIPESAPFTTEQRAWLNGYLAGLFSRVPVSDITGRAAPGPGSSSPTTNNPAALVPLTILFGSQTGTAESLAKRAAKEAGKRGFAATVRDMAGVTPGQLAQEENLLVIVSTYGDGEPPDNAKTLHAALAAQVEGGRDEGVASPAMGIGPGGGASAEVLDAGAVTAPSPLSRARFSVCALGDTNYVQFCRCGKEFDAFLEKLGGARVAPLVECDLDYETRFAGWLEAALGALKNPPAVGAVSRGDESRGKPAPTVKSAGGLTPSVDAQYGLREPRAAARDAVATAGEPLTRTTADTRTDEPRWSRQNPFPALVLASRRLSGTGSAKQVHHVEFALGESGLAYEAGDALGVHAHNCPELVADVLARLGCDGEEAVPAPDGSSVTLRRALLEFYDLGRPTEALLELTMAKTGLGGADLRRDTPGPEPLGSRDEPAPAAAVGAGAPHHVVDALQAGRELRLEPVEFVRVLKRLQPRLYSISSSPRAHGGQVHLTVGAVRYEIHGRARKGVCSTFLAERIQPGATRIPVFVHRNPAFRLPGPGDVPLIMVGPGTGIAPFRAFLHERRATGASGRHWLFFGDQRAAKDFLYQEELHELRHAGVLTRLDTAFSRDRSEKVYVQHRMLEHARELYAWLDDGAHFYVCGDASRMARDVDVALHRVIEIGGGRTSEQAAEYVQALRAAKRYQRDVY